MKFNVGDKVRAIGGRPIRMIGEIVEVNSGVHDDMYLCRFPGFTGHGGNSVAKKKYSTHDHWFMSEGELELIKEKPETIVIYRKGNETIALDKRTGKKAVAKCCPEDTYDFETGAKLAFDRLTGVSNVKEVKRCAKVGEYIKIVKHPRHSIDEYEKGDILKVVNVEPLGMAYYKHESGKYAIPEEYVVLEGYKPDEETKPKYYTGKIILTKGDNIFKTGHIYEVKDGKIKNPRSGEPLPHYRRLEDLDDVINYFDSLELIEVLDD